MIQSIFLFDLSCKNQDLVFKGETSLSKAYGIINRFSEDIDISLDNDPSTSEMKNIKLLIENESKELGLLLNNSIFEKTD